MLNICFAKKYQEEINRREDRDKEEKLRRYERMRKVKKRLKKNLQEKLKKKFRERKGRKSI